MQVLPIRAVEERVGFYVFGIRREHEEWRAGTVGIIVSVAARGKAGFFVGEEAAYQVYCYVGDVGEKDWRAGLRALDTWLVGEVEIHGIA